MGLDALHRTSVVEAVVEQLLVPQIDATAHGSLGANMILASADAISKEPRPVSYHRSPRSRACWFYWAFAAHRLLLALFADTDLVQQPLSA